MNQFLSELKKGNFLISECTNCQKVIWPPSDFCNKCFRDVEWRYASPLGKLIEFSKKENQYFGVAELEGRIRIMGRIRTSKNKPCVGQMVKLLRCNITKNGDLLFDLET